MSISNTVRESLTRSSWIRKMFEEGDQLRRIHGAENVYDFTLGNPDLEPPASFKERLRELANHPVPGMHKYMSNAGYPESRAAVAAYLGRKTGLDLTANHVVMTVGAGGGLNVAFKTLLNPGDEVIVNAPYFVEYGFYAQNHQAKLTVVPSRPDFQIDTDAVAAAITDRTKIILINSPNNPTGVVYTEATLRKLAEVIKKKEAELGITIYLVSDEPYSGLVYDGVTVPSILKIFEHSLLVTSHSKDLALPGERIGYVALSPANPEPGLLFDGLVFANRVLGYVNAPALMQRIVAELQGEVVGVEVYQERRDLLYNHLTGIGFDVVKPQGAFYLFPKSPIPDDVAFIQAAVKYNILLVPGTGFGCPGYFRIAYCVSRETIVGSLPYFTKLAEEFGLKG
ncbi:aspartate aminotransferase [Hydrogenispora ethanolica]|jgi:aspartate aminotransferase|uniref:Aspartate aminotransferase n=1 Tax=Hydrogenispora ethanolica TaxID=1082276 RepID=A0A4R1RA85_HYDET|nr:pyridoxal phosphate-dependent aminotransferase [Hydrogenispora ethanolica]TCL62302.1 aspartate aminotransferase [Hydrogenispora ethanolica]